MQTASRDEEARESCEDQHCFNFSLLSQRMDNKNTAQAQKTCLLQVVVSDEDACDQDGKPSNPPSLILSTYCHYSYTLLIQSQEITFP